MKYQIFSPIIPSVRHCKAKNCSTFFPQFSQLKEKEFRDSLIRVIAEPETTYFYKAYKNAKELVVEYKKIQKLPFLEACEALYQLEGSYIRYEMYISLQGHVLVHNQCCR
jgi:hypothetical protein